MSKMLNTTSFEGLNNKLRQHLNDEIMCIGKFGKDKAIIDESFDIRDMIKKLSKIENFPQTILLERKYGYMIIKNDFTDEEYLKYKLNFKPSKKLLKKLGLLDKKEDALE